MNIIPKKEINKIGLLIYEAENCGAVHVAKKNGIPVVLIKPSEYLTQIEYQNEILKSLKRNNISHIFLLGFQYLILKEILDAYPNKIMNVHPSLFPSFLATKTAIQDALNYGVKITGITTHIIDNEYDKGIILYQEPIRVKEGDTFESLYPKFSQIGISIILKTMNRIESGK
ncbi:formyltransferase family protein [Maribacter aestuarii]|uniref:formyltransferase family protein n=1 Tax=Maribacter aestuarii TaxID=1130723 RepID=UPI00248C73A6|nr:formyltransferase family protein [Maribacter aestuarii]